MDPININSLFPELLPPTQNDLRARGVVEASIEPGRMAAYLAPMRGNNMRRAASGLFGVDTSTAKERLQSSLSNLDLQNPQQAQEAISLIREINPGAAAELQLKIQAAQEASALRTAQSQNQLFSALNQSSQADDRAQKTADIGKQRLALAEIAKNSNSSDALVLARAAETGVFDGKPDQLIAALSPEDSKKFQVVAPGSSIYNLEKGGWETPPSVSSGFSMGDVNPSQYDAASIARARKAEMEANGDPDKINQATALLLPRAPESWEYKQMGTNEDGSPKYIQFPIGKDFADYTQKARSANSSGKAIRNRSKSVVSILDRMITSVENGDAKTGILGVVLSRAPDTNNYTLKGDLNTILANLGYNALAEARANSVDGSSGFGQLTANELTLLQQLVADLDVGMKKDEFLLRLNEVQKSFKDIVENQKTDWDVPSLIGLERVQENEPATPAPSATGGITLEAVLAERNRRANQ